MYTLIRLMLEKMVKELKVKLVYMDNSISDVKSTTESKTLNIHSNTSRWSKSTMTVSRFNFICSKRKDNHSLGPSR